MMIPQELRHTLLQVLSLVPQSSGLLFLIWPLMAFVQMMCARIGMVAGRGLASALEVKFSRSLVRVIGIVLLIANTMKIGADLAGMSDALEVLSGVSAEVFVAPLGFGVVSVTILLRFQQIENSLKWLASILVVYIINVFLVDVNWPQVLRDPV